jgi:Helix-turn-helix domain
MGHRHFNAVQLIKLANPSAKSVLNVLAAHANDYTGRCFPTLERIIDYTGLSRRAVQYAIKEIETAGLVKIVRGKRRLASAYELTLPGEPIIDQGQGMPPIELERGDDRATIARSSDDRATIAQNRATIAPQQKVTELEIEQKEDSSLRSLRARDADPFPRPDWADAQVWSDFMVNRKAKRCRNTATAYRGFLADIERNQTSSWTPAALLEHATAKGWAGIYAPREDDHEQQHAKPRTDKRDGAIKALDKYLNEPDGPTERRPIGGATIYRIGPAT